MGEDGSARAQGLEDLDLGRGVGDVVIAADDVADVEGDVIDDRGQGVKVIPVLAHQHRVGLAGLLDMLRAAHQVIPFDPSGFELEAPVRAAPRSFQALAIRERQRQCRPVIDWRPALAQLDLALEGEFLGAFVAGIKAGDGFQLLGRVVIALKAFSLSLEFVPG